MTKHTNTPPGDVVSTSDDHDVQTPEVASTPATEEKLGYAHPPKDNRWKKGQSGNPKGKKKGTKSFKEYTLEALYKPIVVKDANGSQKVMQIEALFALAFNQALKGNSKLMIKLMALAEQHLPPPPPETYQDAVDKLNKAVEACPGHYVINFEQLEAIEKIQELYGEDPKKLWHP